MGKDFVYITADSQNTLKVSYAPEENIRSILEENPEEKLLYYELFMDSVEAVERRRNLEQWTHRKKRAVVALFNPEWKDCRYEII